MKTAKNSLNYQGRIVGLDAMRAILALFGILMHSGASYMTLFPGFHILWYSFSRQASLGFNWLVLWIHSFYMPAFFFLSGFLSYKIYKKRKLSGLAFSRLTRIALPFLLIYLAPVIFSIVMSIFVQQARHINIWDHVFVTLNTTGPFWFLYYLLLMDLGALLILALSTALKNKLGDAFTKLTQKKIFNALSLALLLLLPVVLLLNSHNWLVPVKISIIPSPSVLAYYATFFALGWVIQHQYKYLIELAKKHWASLAAVSFLGITGNLLLLYYHPHSELAHAVGVLGYSVSALAMFLGLLGFCLQTFQHRNRVIQYLSDSSYWLYISQIPIVLFIESMLSSVQMPLIEKYAITALATVASCLLLYQLIIRKRKIFNYIDCRPKTHNAEGGSLAK